jgi:hypothetical protein
MAELEGKLRSTIDMNESAVLALKEVHRNELEQKEKARQHLESQASDWEKRSTKLEAQQKELQEQYLESVRQSEELAKNLQETRSRLEEYEKKGRELLQLKVEMEGMKRETSKVRERLKESEERAVRLEEKKQMLEKENEKLGVLEKLKREAVARDGELVRYAEQVMRLGGLQRQLEEKVQLREEELRAAENECVKIHEEKNMVGLQLSKLKIEVSELKQKLFDFNEEYTQMSEQREQALSQLSLLKLQVLNIESKSQVQALNYEELLKERDEELGQKSALASQGDLESHRLQVSQSKFEQSVLEKRSLLFKFNSLSKEFDRVSQELFEQRRGESHLKVQLEKSNAEVSALKLRQLEREGEQRAQRSERGLGRDREGQEAEMDRGRKVLEVQLAEERKRYDKLFEELEEQEEASRKEISRLEQQVYEYQGENTRLQMSYDKLRIELNGQRNLTQSDEVLESIRKEASHENRLLMQEYCKLAAILEEKEVEIERLKLKGEELRITSAIELEGLKNRGMYSAESKSRKSQEECSSEASGRGRVELEELGRKNRALEVEVNRLKGREKIYSEESEKFRMMYNECQRALNKAKEDKLHILSEQSEMIQLLTDRDIDNETKSKVIEQFELKVYGNLSEARPHN